ncbi:MAG: PaaI family thioesterase [Hyphomicrobiales bacterium]|nr:PaaI family thioesterase [Hyphomicrobiales bacterium]
MATSGTRSRAAMTAEEVAAYIAAEFPQVAGAGALTVEAADARHARVRFATGAQHLRPGGTISGPTQFFLADVAAFMAVLAAIGPVGHAVTTSANINFLKKPAPGDLIAETRILKRGKRLVVVDCLILSEGESDPVAHAVLTYSIPEPTKSAV